MGLGGATELASLLIAIKADTSGLTVGLQKGLNESIKFEKSLKGVMSQVRTGINSVARAATLMGGALLAVAGTAMTMLVSKSLTNMDAMAKLSDRTGVQTEKLAGMKLAAEDAGVGFERLTGGMDMARRKIGEAVVNGGEAGVAFRRLGLDVKTLANMRPDEQFGTIADALNKVENATERAQIQTQIFGRSGAELTNVLRLGSAGLNAATEEAKALGIAVSRIDAAKAEIAGDSMARIGMVMEGVGNQLATKLSPYLAAIADYLVNAAKESGGFGDAMDAAINFAVDAVGFLADAWQGLHVIWLGLKVGVAELVKGAVVAISGWRDAIVYVGGILSNLGTAFVDTGKVIGSSFNLAWQTIRLGVGSLVSYVAEKLASMLAMAADTIGRVDNDLADKLRASESAVQRYADETNASVKKSFSDAKESAALAAEDMRASWSSIGDVQVDMDPEWEALKEGAREAATEAHYNLDQALNQPLNSDVLKASIADAVAGVNAKAEEIAKAAPASQAPGGTVGDIESEEEKKKRAEKLEELRKELATEQEIEMEAYLEKQALLQELQLKGDITEAERKTMLEQLEEDHQAKLVAIRANAIQSGEKLSRQSWQAQVGHAVTSLNAIVQSVESSSKTMFQIQKAAAIANAIVNTAQGATKALAQGGFFGIAMAAAVVAAGAAQIGTIAGTSIGGGSKSAAIGPAPAVSDGNQQATGRDGALANAGAGPSRSITVNFGDSNRNLFTRDEMRQFIREFGEAIGDGVKVNVQ